METKVRKEFYKVETGLFLRYDEDASRDTYQIEPSFRWDYAKGNSKGYFKEIAADSKNKRIPSFILIEKIGTDFYESLTKTLLVSEVKKTNGLGIYYRDKVGKLGNAILPVQNEQQLDHILKQYAEFDVAELTSLMEDFAMRGFEAKNRLDLLDKGKRR